MLEKIDYLIGVVEHTLKTKFDLRSYSPDSMNISDWGQLTVSLDTLRKLRQLAERGVLEDVKEG